MLSQNIISKKMLLLGYYNNKLKKYEYIRNSYMYCYKKNC